MYSRFIITLFGIVGLIWGAIVQQFSQTVYTLGAGLLLASLVCNHYTVYNFTIVEILVISLIVDYSTLAHVQTQSLELAKTQT